MIWRLIGFAIGVWLMVAPYVLSYAGQAEVNDRICGPLIATFSLIAISDVTDGLRRINIPIGVWLILSPLVLQGYETASTANSIVSGLAVALIAWLGSSKREHDYGGGWSILFRTENW